MPSTSETFSTKIVNGLATNTKQTTKKDPVQTVAKSLPHTNKQLY